MNSDSAKRVFIVVGPESSGNRLLTSILCRAGCVGSGSTKQPLEPSMLVDQSPAVIYRSVPYGGDKWPNLHHFYHTLRARDYEVIFLVMVRDPFCVQKSAINTHCKDFFGDYLDFLCKVYRYIFSEIKMGQAPFVMIPYEALVSHPREFSKQLLEYLGLSTDTIDQPLIVQGKKVYKICDGNAKYYK